MIEVQYNPTELSSTRAPRSPRSRFRARCAAAAIRPRPGREADPRTILRHHRSRHGHGRDQRHHADRPDLSAGQDRADAPRAADLHFHLERRNSPAARLKEMPAAPRACDRRQLWCGGGRGCFGRGAAVSAVASAVAGIANAASGNQRRNGFKCIVESVKQKFTLFSPEGVPLRATLPWHCANTRRSMSNSLI